MIPYLLAAVGGYLIGDSMKESQTFADGGKIRAWDEASRKLKELKNRDSEYRYFYDLRNKDRDESWYNTTRKIREEKIYINSKIDALKKEYFESEEGKSELSKAIKFLNDIEIESRWKGRKGESHSDNWWLYDAKTEFNYIGNQDAEQLIKFAINQQNFYKGLSVEQIKAKRELERKQEEIYQAREDIDDDNKWIVKYISTDDNDVASVWVIAKNREDAIEQAKEDNWDIGEIISVEN